MSYLGLMENFVFNAAFDTAVNSAAPDEFGGALPSIDISSDAESSQGLLYFDIFGDAAGQIEAGSTIVSASLTLQVTDATIDDIALHRMIVSWSESSTWDSLLNGVSTDGAEAFVAPDASLSGASLGLVTIDVTTSLSAWSQGEQNWGWVLTGGTDPFAFDSAEGGVSPVLTVVVEEVQPTSGTVSFQQGVSGYTGTTDTYIRENRATTDYSGLEKVYVEGSEPGGGEMQALLSFDSIFGNQPGQIPLGAVITSATLDLDIGDQTTDPVTLHQMLIDWDGTPTLTWDAFGSGIQTDGTEASSEAIASLPFGISASSGTIDVTASLQAWSDGEQNHGWLLSSVGEDIWRFASSESGSAPVLTVTYDTDVTPPPSSGTLTFEQGVDGYDGVDDTYIREIRPTSDYSSITKVYIEGAEQGGGEMQALLSFDSLFGDGPGQIPLGAVITSASLDLEIGDSTIDSISVYDMLIDWDAAPDRTWDAFANGIQTDGAEASDTAVATLPFGIGNGTGSIDVTSSLQSWSDGAENNGWLIRSMGEDLWRFAASESGTGPVLTVSYTTDATPPPTSGTLSFEQDVNGYTAVSDTYVRENRATTDYSTNTKVYVEGSEPTGGEMQALISFGDLFGTGAGLIPSGATITSATLELEIGDSTDDTVSFHQMLIDWDAAPDQTWDAFSAGIQTDDIEASSTAVATSDGLSNGIQSIDVTVSLQAWSDGSANEGWLVRSSGEDLWRFASSESGNGPVLTVSYTLDPVAPVFNPTLLATYDATQYNADDPSGAGSGDPSGLAYVPGLDVLFLADSEHDESPYFSPINLCAIRLDGTYVGAYSMAAFTDEPTGLFYNPANDRLYVSDDDAQKIFIVDPSDPTVSESEIDLSALGIDDAEEPVVDPVTGNIFLLDGQARTLYELDSLGGFIDSTVLPTEILDVEGLAYDAENEVFFLASGANRGVIFQMDRDANILGSSDLLNDESNPVTGGKPKIKALEFAPSSDPSDGDQMSLYVADYGSDQVADGRIFELDPYDDFQVV